MLRYRTAPLSAAAAAALPIPSLVLVLVLLLLVQAPLHASAIAGSGGPAAIAPADWRLPSGDGEPRLSRQPMLVEEPAEADPLAVTDDLQMDTFARINRTGRGQLPRTIYQSPPFPGDDFFKPGGIWTVGDPKLFLAPIRAGFLYEGSGLLGGQFEARVWGNSIFSGGIGLWGLARQGGHGDFYRVEGDFGVLLWLGTQANFEFGLLGGIERDVLLVSPFDNRYGFEFGTTTRLLLWRFEFRADWLMRLATTELQTGTLRHSGRFSVKFEPLRIGMVGLEVGGWAHVVTHGAPRIGASVGLRIWFGVDRQEPEYIRRYRTLTRAHE